MILHESGCRFGTNPWRSQAFVSLFFLREGSTKFQLLTSIATYIDYEGGAAKINVNTVGFMGDRAVSGGGLRDLIAAIVSPSQLGNGSR